MERGKDPVEGGREGGREGERERERERENWSLVGRVLHCLQRESTSQNGSVGRFRRVSEQTTLLQQSPIGLQPFREGRAASTVCKFSVQGFVTESPSLEAWS